MITGGQGTAEATALIPSVPGEAAPGKGACSLRKEDLHGSLRAPVLDTMNFLNEVTLRHPEAISFAPGRPYDGFFEVEEILSYIRRYLDYLARRGSTPAQVRGSLVQYGPTAGQIRELIADSLRRDEDIAVPAESIVVTVGCQEAMLLALRALIAGPADVFLVASPCYVGISGAACLLDIEPVPVEEREDGFHCADLEAAIRAVRENGRRPRAFYVVPDHSNPAGTTLSVEARHELLELAAREDIIILEDSPYRLVSPRPHLPSLKALDRQRRVVQLGSFSKSAFPGARLGYVVADQPVVDAAGGSSLLADELAKIKSMVTVNTSPLSQAAVAGLLLASAGRLSDFNERSAEYYANAMRLTLHELDVHFPEPLRTSLGVRWNKPDGGFFLTMRVPFRVDSAALERSAQDFGVIWTPMAYFHPAGGGDHSIRLSVSYLPHADIPEGIARLGRFVIAEAGRR
jgi:(S)-3,5-dihydroxyphenylglycine transaminase